MPITEQTNPTKRLRAFIADFNREFPPEGPEFPRAGELAVKLRDLLDQVDLDMKQFAQQADDCAEALANLTNISDGVLSPGTKWNSVKIIAAKLRTQATRMRT